MRAASSLRRLVGRYWDGRPSFSAMACRAALQVDKVLKGARPADMPIEQPTQVDLWINLKTAATLGLTLPPSLRVQATRVVE